MRRQALLAAVALALAAAGCASAGRSLVVVTLANDVDVTALNAPIQVYDHFFTGKDGASQHRYVAEVATGDLAKVRARTASLEVVDVPGRSSFYYWFQAPKGVEAVAEKLGARIVYRRSSQEVLVQLNVPLSSVNWPYTIHVVPVDRTTAIPPLRISRHAYDTTFRRHMMPLPPHVSHVSAVQDILDNFDFGACEGLVRQLAGTDPIQVNGSPYTVVTRELCGPDIDPLIDWLNTDLTASGLNVTIDTMSYMDPGCSTRRHRQVIATIPGTDLADQLWIVMAHLDAVPGTPGADDNASGVTALLCTAKALAHPASAARQFVAVNAEEVGSRGSHDVATRPPPAPSRSAARTMDMVAWTRPRPEVQVEQPRRRQLRVHARPPDRDGRRLWPEPRPGVGVRLRLDERSRLVLAAGQARGAGRGGILLRGAGGQLRLDALLPAGGLQPQLPPALRPGAHAADGRPARDDEGHDRRDRLPRRDPVAMRALVKSRAEAGLWLEDVPEPKIGINDVLIRVHRTGICGTDVHIYDWDEWAAKKIQVPLVVGHESGDRRSRLNVTDHASQT